MPTMPMPTPAVLLPPALPAPAHTKAFKQWYNVRHADDCVLCFGVYSRRLPPQDEANAPLLKAMPLTQRKDVMSNISAANAFFIQFVWTSPAFDDIRAAAEARLMTKMDAYDRKMAVYERSCAEARRAAAEIIKQKKAEEKKMIRAATRAVSGKQIYAAFRRSMGMNGVKYAELAAGVQDACVRAAADVTAKRRAALQPPPPPSPPPPPPRAIATLTPCDL
jgi:bacterioferritin-associated ferredoxin